MFRWCSYCQSYLGEIKPYDDYSLTHGICSKCKPKAKNFSKADLNRIKPIIAFYNELREAVQTGLVLEPIRVLEKGHALKIRPMDFLIGSFNPCFLKLVASTSKRKYSLSTSTFFL